MSQEIQYKIQITSLKLAPCSHPINIELLADFIVVTSFVIGSLDGANIINRNHKIHKWYNYHKIMAELIRPSKTDYYLDIAKQVSLRGTCLRRNFGAVIVKDDRIISTGYAGAPRGVMNCIDIGKCPRKAAGIPPGERYELCRSVHAEANAIIHASANDMQGATLYLVSISKDDGSIFDGGKPCKMCSRLIINSGIKTVIMRRKDNGIEIENVEDWIKNDDPDITKSMSGY